MSLARTAEIRYKVTDAGKAEADIKGVGESLKKTDGAAGKAGKSMKQASTSTDLLGKSMSGTIDNVDKMFASTDKLAGIAGKLNNVLKLASGVIFVDFAVQIAGVAGKMFDLATGAAEAKEILKQQAEAAKAAAGEWSALSSALGNYVLLTVGLGDITAIKGLTDTIRVQQKVLGEGSKAAVADQKKLEAASVRRGEVEAKIDKENAKAREQFEVFGQSATERSSSALRKLRQELVGIDGEIEDLNRGLAGFEDLRVKQLADRQELETRIAIVKGTFDKDEADARAKILSDEEKIAAAREKAAAKLAADRAKAAAAAAKIATAAKAEAVTLEVDLDLAQMDAELDEAVAQFEAALSPQGMVFGGALLAGLESTFAAATAIGSAAFDQMAADAKSAAEFKAQLEGVADAASNIGASADIAASGTSALTGALGAAGIESERLQRAQAALDGLRMGGKAVEEGAEALASFGAGNFVGAAAHAAAAVQFGIAAGVYGGIAAGAISTGGGGGGGGAAEAAPIATEPRTRQDFGDDDRGAGDLTIIVQTGQVFGTSSDVNRAVSAALISDANRRGSPTGRQLRQIVQR